jgi:hypothetical protein
MTIIKEFKVLQPIIVKKPLFNIHTIKGITTWKIGKNTDLTFNHNLGYYSFGWQCWWAKYNFNIGFYFGTKKLGLWHYRVSRKKSKAF